jgi:chromosome segregation ATPase
MTAPKPEFDLDELDRLQAAASPGEWTSDTVDNAGFVSRVMYAGSKAIFDSINSDAAVVEEEHDGEPEGSVDRFDSTARANFEFTAALRNAWPAVSKRMRELAESERWHAFKLEERTDELITMRTRAESAEARAQEFERAFRNLVARIDGDGGQCQEGGTVAGSLERADTKVVTLQARVKELEESLYRQVCRAEVAENRITSLESELSEARLDLERWYTSVEAHRLATILEQRDEARAEVKALEKGRSGG